MATKYDFDYIVIGSGAAGGTAALMAARAGKKVGLVEAKRWGGSGYPAAIHWRAEIARRASAGSKKSFEAAGIECIPGFAHFIRPNAITVGNKGEFTARKFIIATGSVPKESGITGATTIKCLTPGEVMNMTKLPRVALVVGAGASGCEVTEHLAKSGVKVILLELSDRILPREDSEVGEVLEQRFAKKLGVKVLTQARAVAIQGVRNVKKVIFLKDGCKKSVKVEEVILANGVRPATDLGLENAGVKYGVKGIKVDKALATSARNIFAIGDVAATVSEISSTEKAAYDAAVAMSASINRAKGIADYRGFVRMTDTYPQVACVGLTEDDCIRRDLKYTKDLVPLSLISAASINDFRDGFVKIIINREKKIIGATVVCPGADMVIQEIVLAMRMEMKLLDIATAPHVSMGWNEAVRIAARRLAGKK